LGKFITPAEKLKEIAEQGDMQALKEIGDRLEGKPKQQTEHSGPDDSTPTSIAIIFVDGDKSKD